MSSRESKLPLLSTSLVATVALTLGGCGGGAQPSAPAHSTQVPAGAASGAAGHVTAAVPLPSRPVQPTFHMLPAVLDAPGDDDAFDPLASARRAPQSVAVRADLAGLGTRRLTPQALGAALQRAHAAGAVSPAAAPLQGAVYTPAQMRAAYGLPDLPPAGTVPSPDQRAALGAGQTIYIIDAHEDPNAYPELQAFSAKFGLPSCTRVPVPPATPMPLTPAPAACTFSKTLSTPSGALTATVPSYDAGWASEIALDLQWAHALAPLARLVLVEAASATNNDLLGAVQAANRMGPGVVSMSFGGSEGAWSPMADTTFTAPGMTYLASTGDSGAGVNWPAVSAGVLAVGGTSLTWTGSGTRSETAWSGSGGGISAYEPLPAWQTGVGIAGGGTLAMRAVADVAFNADPYTGQYVAIMPPNTSVASWYAYGGTSISSPQWAGILAVANAQRVAAGKALLGDVHAMLYGDIAGPPGTYAAAFADIVAGGDGGCATCAAGSGLDQATGWGTPNAAMLLPLLVAEGAVLPVNHPPAIAGAPLAATTGTPFTAQVSGTDPDGDALTYRLAGGPAGMTISDGGLLAWPRPVRGTYALKITVRDPGGLSATATFNLVVRNPNVAPVVANNRATWPAGKPMMVPMQATDANGDPVVWSLGDGAPSGMLIGPHGGVQWPSPVAGHYVISVVATDPGGLSGTGTLTLDVDTPPTLAGGPISASRGQPLSVTIAGADADGDPLTYTVTGQPAGVQLSAAGQLTWANPVKGSWKLTVTVHDGRGLVSTAVFTLTVSA